VHISPAFVFADTVFIDSDKNAKKFFSHDELAKFVSKRKEYDENSRISFHGINYKKAIRNLINQCDLLISQYAGFVSNTCKEYLKIGGILLVNNSHGDAGLASIDKDYKFIATVQRIKGKYRISEDSLEKYFVPKKNIDVTKELLFEIQKGVGYTKTAPLYVFKRIS
jgi:cytochrome c2